MAGQEEGPFAHGRIGIQELRRLQAATKPAQEWELTAFHPKKKDLTKELREAIDVFPWCRPMQAGTPFLVHIPNNITSERPLAVLPTFVRWWMCLRALVVQGWKIEAQQDGTSQKEAVREADRNGEIRLLCGGDGHANTDVSFAQCPGL